MNLNAKRAIISIVSLSLLANLFLCVYLIQIKTNIDTYKNKIVELEKENNALKENNEALLDDNEYFKKQYQKYYELCEELENQMGVYYE